jgi:hypothetical protein
LRKRRRECKLALAAAARWILPRVYFQLSQLGSVPGWVSVGAEVFAEAQKVSVGIAEDELVHLPVARGEWREDRDASCAKLGFEWSGFAGRQVDIKPWSVRYH